MAQHTNKHLDISVVVATFRRPAEVSGLLDNLSEQTILPAEVILVDGAPFDDRSTQEVVRARSHSLPFACRYLRSPRGTAAQRNAGIDAAKEGLIAFVDDDVRLEADFFTRLVAVFEPDKEKKVGGVVGYRTNQYFDQKSARRYRWYQRLKLLTTFEPGRYDFNSGYPINANAQPPFNGVRPVDFMTTACAMWRREVFDSGLRFDSFFRDYGVLEDAHFSLCAGRDWMLLQCGDAHCEEMHSPRGRIDGRSLGFKCVVNYYYVFQDIVRPLTLRHKLRFWRFQAFELLRLGASAIRRRRLSDIRQLQGRLEGMAAIARGNAF